MWQLWERQPLTTTTRSRWPFLLCCMLATCIHSTNDHKDRFGNGSPHCPALPRPTGSCPTFLDHTAWHGFSSTNHLDYGNSTWCYHLHQPSCHSCLCAYNCSGHPDLQCVCSWYRAADQTLCTNWHPYILASHSKGGEGANPASTLLRPTGFPLQLLPPPPNWLSLLCPCIPHLQGLQHAHLQGTHRGLCSMRPRASMPLLRATGQHFRLHPLPWQGPCEDRQDCLYFGFHNDRAFHRSALSSDRSLVSHTGGFDPTLHRRHRRSPDE